MPDPVQPQGSVRSMDHMRALHRSVADGGHDLKVEDGFCRPLPYGDGFRYDYHGGVANGGWTFHDLGAGLSVAIVDVKTAVPIRRRHRLTDQLVVSAVLDGNLDIFDPAGTDARLLNGFATIYGLLPDQAFETLYPPGQALHWISVFIEREALHALTGLEAEDLSDEVNDFVAGAQALPYRNVRLSHAAALCLHQMLAPPYDASFARSLLRLKALELACHALHGLRFEQDMVRPLGADEIARIERAFAIVKRTPGAPRSIDDLAAAVGLNRKRLQHGFRARYGATVGQTQEQLRMEHALHLVRDTGLSITEIGFEAGYEHHASFTRAFKAAFGQPPAALRASLRRQAG